MLDSSVSRFKEVSVMADDEKGEGRERVANPIGKIRVPKTSEIVADHFRGQIVRGELQEGDFLPPEGQLMTSLGISRPTLREAFRILEAENLISVVRGSRTGARVHPPSVELVSRYAGYVLQSQGTTIADLYEARLAVEPHVVRRLATSPNPAAIKKLRAEVERQKLLLNQERFTDYIVSVAEFHRVLVAVTGNKTLRFLNELMLHLLAAHHVDYVRRHPQPVDSQRKSLAVATKSFDKLIDLIEAGDVDRAIAHWRLHLQNANATWASRDEANRVVDSLGG
jgi:DNA-binding FadR family transcriptional regulator